MKRLDDKNIINAVKANEKYQIKTTSNDILLAYKKEVEREKLKKSKKGWIFGSLGGLALAGACAIGVMFLMNQEPKLPHPSEIFSPTNNKALRNQLVTFATFNTPVTNTSMKMKHFSNKLLNVPPVEEETEPDKNPEITIDHLNKIADVYENVQSGINEVFHINDVIISTKEGAFEHLGVNYKHEDTFKDSKTDLEIARFYYNDFTLVEEDKDEKTIEFNGLYFFEETYYYATFVHETEGTSTDGEIELSAVFHNADKTSDHKIYVVEKEQEFENRASENSYSYYTFKNEEELKAEKYLTKVAYEFEADEMQVEYLDKVNSTEIKFKDILQVEPHTYTFNTKVEVDGSECNCDVEVKYDLEANTRTYTSKTLTVTRP